MHFHTFLFVALGGLLSTASAAAISKAALVPRAVSGKATHYGGNLAGGTCSFTTLPSIPAGLYGTAVGDWNNGAHCGACVSVKGPNGNSITAMVVDKCPECDTTHLDLFENAFAKLGALATGIIPISFDYVKCPFSTPLQLHSKSGASKYWFSMQVVGANKAVKSLEVSKSGSGSWLPTVRKDYNFFEFANHGGVGASTGSVRVTSVDGDVMVVNNVSLGDNASTTASKNF